MSTFGGGADSVGTDNGDIATPSISGSNGLTGAQRASYVFQLTYVGGTNYIITSFTATFGDATNTAVVATLTGANIKVSIDSSNTFSPANATSLEAAINRLFVGDDFMTLAGSLSVAWGDFGAVPTKGGVMGDDVIIGGTVVLPTGIAQLLVVGDALSIGSGVTAQGGDDVIRMLATSVKCRIYGDFQTVSGTARFGNDVLYGGSDSDLIFGDTAISGKAGGKDWINGGAGDDQIFGGGGNDRLNGGELLGNDLLNGGAGFDIASYTSNSVFLATMIADLADSSLNTLEAAGDTYIGIEGLAGRRTSDDLRGDSKANSLFGLQSSDRLTGRAGNDTLVGGGGSDVFVFDATLNAKSNVDHIRDFASTSDKIELNLAIFDVPSTAGVLNASAFNSNLTGEAADKSDRIIYETDTGKILYDADGLGGADGILFAILDGKPALVASDFQIV